MGAAPTRKEGKVMKLTIDGREVASVLGVSSRMVTRLAERGEIPAIRIGSVWRFPRERLREYLER